jgi:2-aminoadipate transaminase
LALVDKEIANTLGELERKLRELERVLGAMGESGSAADADSSAAGAADTSGRSAGSGSGGSSSGGGSGGGSGSSSVGSSSSGGGGGGGGGQQSAGGGAPTFAARVGSGRLIDEALDRERALGTTAAAATPTSEPVADAGRIADPGGRRATDVSPARPAATSVIAPPPDEPARHSPRRPPPPADRAPTAGELLRFRDRLERTARELTHDYDELLGRITYATVPTPTGPTISFARGAPSLDIVDVQGLRDAAERAFDSDPGGTTAYGTSIGYPRLRAWIADRHGVEPERVLVTNGSMQADAFLFEHLVRPGDDVVVERPSYDRTLLSLRERGATLHAVELQPDGVDTQALSRLLSSRKVRPKLAHIIPNFQNPAGYTLSLPKREALLALAIEHDFLVFEDDPYVALRFSGESMPTMLSMNPGRVVYASSFSKTVCPGIRVGYLVGPPDLIAAIARLATNTYISPNMVAQSIVYEFCASGAIERSIETVRAALAKRALTLSQALRRELPEAEFVMPDGGYFMWVTLPPGTDVARLFDAAAELGVSFVKGTDFLLEGGENTLRLAFSGVTEQQIDEGVTRLAAAYRSL